MPRHSIPETPHEMHPYVRISHPEQKKGGGLERQTSADLTEFGRRFGFTLGKRMWVDDGVSAFKGLNATPNHQLGQFLGEARKGLVRPGDCLLIENWDRLSRQDVWAAIGLVNELRQLGIHVGRLDRMKLLRCDSTDPGDFFEAALELMRGNSESAAKSDRNGRAWEKKREAARRGQAQPPRHRDRRVTACLTSQLPAWVEEAGGELRLIPARAAVVKRIFALAAGGYGYHSIIRRLTEEGVPPFTGYAVVTGPDGTPELHDKGRRMGKPKLRAVEGKPFGAGKWTRPYLVRLLNDRRAVGEFQPRGRGRKPDGPPIPGYFPPAVTEEEYWAAQGAADKRRKKSRGGKDVRAYRVGRHVNLWAGLVWCAYDGDAYVATTKSLRTLVTKGSNEGHAGSLPRSFPLEVFERAFLKCLKEIDPHDILNGDEGPDETLALRAELERVNVSVLAIEADLDAHGESPTQHRRLRAKEDEQRSLAEKLAEARRRAAHPLSETWGECQSLIDALDNAPDPKDARVRLRAALRRVVDSVWMLVVPLGRDRLTALQVYFCDRPVRRDYLVSYQAAGFHRLCKWDVGSLADAAGPADLDLRKPADAKRLERWLSERGKDIAAALAGE